MSFSLPFIGNEVPAAVFQSINAFFIIVLGTAVGSFWHKWKNKGKESSSLFKMAIGVIIMAFGFFFMSKAASEVLMDGSEVAEKSAMIWLVLAYLFHTIGELCASPVALSFITKLAPIKYASFMMGAYFAATGLGNKVAGYIDKILFPNLSHVNKNDLVMTLATNDLNNEIEQQQIKQDSFKGQRIIIMSALDELRDNLELLDQRMSSYESLIDQGFITSNHLIDLEIRKNQLTFDIQEKTLQLRKIDDEIFLIKNCESFNLNFIYFDLTACSLPPSDNASAFVHKLGFMSPLVIS